MKILRAILFIIIVLFLKNNSFSEINFKENNPDLKIDLGCMFNGNRPVISYNVSIFSPNLERSWYYSVRNSSELDSSREVIATNWYKNSGNYKLLIEYAVGMDNIPGKKSDIEFFVTGDELEIRANIYFNTLDIDSTVNLSNFYIKRYYNSSDSVTIVSKWIPNPNKELLYVIKNNTKRIIYSVVWDRNFSGYIENNDNGQGKIYFRGKAIGIGNSYKQVFPGDSVDSYEPLFFDSKSFIVNKYVYEAYYSFAETLLGIPVNKSKNTMKGIFDYYLLRSEFEIKE